MSWVRLLNEGLFPVCQHSMCSCLEARSSICHYNFGWIFSSSSSRCAWRLLLGWIVFCKPTVFLVLKCNWENSHCITLWCIPFFGGSGGGSGVSRAVYSLYKIVSKELRTVFWCVSWSCWIRSFWQEMVIHSAVLEGPAWAHRLTCYQPVQVLEVLLWVMWMSQSHFCAVSEAEVCSFIALQCELWSFGLCVAGGCVWYCSCLLWNAQQQVEAPTAVWGLWLVGLVHFGDCFHPLVFTFPFLPPLLASCFLWQALWAPLKVCTAVMLWALSLLPLETLTNIKWSLFSAAARSVIKWTPELVVPFSSMLLSWILQLFLKLSVQCWWSKVLG